MITATSKKQPKQEVGVVTSNKMMNTLVVEVTTKTRHEKYGKVINQRKRCYVDNKIKGVQVGDTVTIVPTRPLSKLKRWRTIAIKSQTEATELVKE